MTIETFVTSVAVLSVPIWLVADAAVHRARALARATARDAKRRAQPAPSPGREGLRAGVRG